jgi:hypothetical protein
MKTFVVIASIVGMIAAAANAQNANITWQSPTDISGSNDVSTNGLYFASWAPYNQDSYNNENNGLMVNGTKFLANTDLENLVTVNFNSGYTFYNNPGTSDANYNDILQSAAYNGNGDGSPLQMTWGEMVPGHTYLVQLWANDGRGNGRSQTYTGGANTSARLQFGTPPTQWIIGTFVCDNTGTEQITMSGVGSVNGSYPQLNLFQVRDITKTPIITWQSPTAISAATDVSTWGYYFGSWAPGDTSANSFPVNGVTFQDPSDLPNLSTADFTDGYSSYQEEPTGDDDYTFLLETALYNGTGDGMPATFSWNGMTQGHTYLVQLWANDGRGNGRTETFTGGTNAADTSATLDFGDPPGEWIIGTFVADATGSQTISLSGAGSPNGPYPQMNLVQVRDITLVITSINVSGTTLSLTATNGKPGGPFTLLGSANLALLPSQWTSITTGNFDGNGNLSISANLINPAASQHFYILSE